MLVREGVLEKTPSFCCYFSGLACLRMKKKIIVYIINIPEDVQLTIVSVLGQYFPDREFKIFTSLSGNLPDVAFTSSSSDFQMFEKFPKIPLFLFLENGKSEDTSLSELSKNRPLFDYCFLDDPADRIEKRIRIFVNSLLRLVGDEKSKNSDIRKLSAGFLDKAKTVISRLFMPRRHEVSLEMSPVVGNKWERIRRLGFGSFGEVWLVRRVGTISDHYAVAKIPHDSRMNKKFIQEAEILKRLEEHPNSVKLIEVLEQSGKTVLIEEYVDGKTLQDLIDEGMEPAQKEHLFSQILDMIAFAHDRRIMHRDLKPENILVTSQDLVKVLDFGTAKDVSAKSVSSTIVGSRPYMAPEQILGKSRLASDVWALGVLLYALSTEFLPFYSEREKELMDLILESEPQRPSALVDGIPSELERIILKCLEKDVSKRYATARHLQEDIFRTFPDFGKGRVIPM